MLEILKGKEELFQDKYDELGMIIENIYLGNLIEEYAEEEAKEVRDYLDDCNMGLSLIREIEININNLEKVDYKYYFLCLSVRKEFLRLRIEVNKYTTENLKIVKEILSLLKLFN